MPERPPLFEVAGVPIASTRLADAVDRLIDLTEAGGYGESLRFVNAFSVVSAHHRPDYLKVMRAQGVSYPDGASVAAVLRLVSGARRSRRIRGPSFFEQALLLSAGRDVRHFFLGTTDDTLARLISAVHKRSSASVVAGAYAPPFSEQGAEAIRSWAERIRASGANCVWIALGTPKQDLVAATLSRELRMPCVAVGAAFDFLAATKRQAPHWMQRAGIEWIFRLVTEPRRLWKRYLIGNIAFIGLVLTRRNGPVRA